MNINDFGISPSTDEKLPVSKNTIKLKATAVSTLITYYYLINILLNKWNNIIIISENISKSNIFQVTLILIVIMFEVLKA